jgi:hypothetical protein
VGHPDQVQIEEHRRRHEIAVGTKVLPVPDEMGYDVLVPKQSDEHHRGNRVVGHRRHDERGRVLLTLDRQHDRSGRERDPLGEASDVGGRKGEPDHRHAYAEHSLLDDFETDALDEKVQKRDEVWTVGQLDAAGP